MIPWCRQEIPVDVNFGDVYDKLNDCINRLRGDFGASLVYKVEFASSGSPYILISVTFPWVLLYFALQISRNTAASIVTLSNRIVL